MDRAALVAVLPRFVSRGLVPSLRGGFAYRERWMPGSRARARLMVLRSAGLVPVATHGRVEMPGIGVVDITELRLDPAPDMRAIPAFERRDLARGDATRQLGKLVVAQNDLAIAAAAEGILRAALERALRGEAGWQEEATAALGPRSEASDRLMEALGSALGDAQAAHAACAGLRRAIAEARSAGAIATAERDAIDAVGAKVLLHLAAVMAEPGSLATRVFREAAATAVRVSDAVALIAAAPVDGRLPAEIRSLFPELDTGRVRRRIASDADEVAARLEAR